MTVSLINQNIADIPVIVAAIDPCLSCTSRITILNERGRKPSEMTWAQLVDHGQRFYRKEGRS